jgi:UDP:flavonoid glycosyltransferase YjiC (YdhE family)
MVLLPHFADQFVNATRVAASGAGVALEAGHEEDGRRRRATEHALDLIESSINRVSKEPSFREAAQRVAREMETSPTPEVLLADLEAHPGRRHRMR